MALEPTDLAPGLLLAMPQLNDPNFSRSVVLMIDHNEQGSFGLVINHPSPIKATELLDSLEMSWRGDDHAVVWSGGPVSPSTGWVLHEPWPSEIHGGMIAVTPAISLSTSPDRLRALAFAPPPRIRLLLGYSGWGPGQLAEEMAHGAWLHVAADPSLVFETPADQIWEAAVRSLGIDPEQMFSGRGVN
jgi:putative transcriptional regulator